MSEEEYSIDECYIHSTDKRGHVIQFRVALPPDQYRRAEQLIATGKFKWRSIQDICRDGMIHRMHWASEQDPLAQEIYDIFRVSAEVGQALAVREASEKIVSSYRELAGGLRGKERLQLAVTIQEKIDDSERLQLSNRTVRQLRDLIEQLKYDDPLG